MAAPNATYSYPKFTYVLPRSSRYAIVLERTASMDVNGRWTNIKRSLYRFIQRLPIGSQVTIITFGKEATINLPSTILTDTNREGLHGRIPRKVLQEELACVYCALNMSFQELGEGGTVVLLTGSPRRPQMLGKMVERAAKENMKVFPIAYPGTAYPEIVSLARHGKHYAVPEGDKRLNPLSYLNEVLIDVLRHSEVGLDLQKVHETRHLSYEFAGTFTLEDEMLHRMSVTLNVDDEERVEFFEITNPSGRKHLFSKFEDGMVVFNHPGTAEPGIWTYHAKLYQTSGLPLERMSVDVVSQSNNVETRPIVLDVFTNVDGSEVDAYTTPVIIYARLTQGSAMPVLGGSVVAKIFRPGDNAENGAVEVVLRDDGSGDPDVTGDDGVYSAYFSDLATVPGFYSVQVFANHNEGLARTVKQVVATSSSKDEDETSKSNNCCGSRVRFRETIPSSPFHRQSAGTGFYVKQGLSPRTDIAPPSRILDFRLAKVIKDSLYVQLEWSAPGGDYDKGRGT